MKHNKAAGEDGLISTYVEGSIRGVRKPLLNLIKRSLEETIIPGDPANYRPVCLTSQIWKIMDRIIKEDIVKFTESNNLFNNSQHGFRQKRSCLTNLLGVCGESY